jgi:hypothetical protein
MGRYRNAINLVLGLIVLTWTIQAQEVRNTLPIHDYERDDVKSPWAPGFHPYLEPDFFTGGGGYGSGFTSSGGIDYDARRFELQLEGTYGFIRKTNDNDQVPNEHGHTRGVDGLLYYRLHEWFLGGGASWGETAVTPYRKYAWAPGISAGHAFFYHFTDFRIQAGWSHSLHEYTDYPTIVQFTPGPGQSAFSTYCICNNGVNAYNLDVSVSLSDSGHVLLHSNFNVLRFHETVTDPYNLSMTAQQDADHGTAVSLTSGVQFRF